MEGEMIGWDVALQVHPEVTLGIFSIGS